MAILRRKRLPDGSLGELENVFGDEVETGGGVPSGVIERLEQENLRLQTEVEEVNNIINILLGGQDDEE